MELDFSFTVKENKRKRIEKHGPEPLSLSCLKTTKTINDLQHLLNVSFG
jgi:hypothetical protein